MAIKKHRSKLKTIWQDIKFKYRLTITNENTLEEVAGVHVSKLNVISLLLFVLFVTFTVVSAFITYTPLRNYMPGYMNSEIREQVVLNALRADSLEMLIDRQSLYIMNIQDIFFGRVKPDTIQSMDSLTQIRQDTLMERTQREAEFRRQYEEAEKYNLNSLNATNESAGLIFHRPTRGMISTPFNADAHVRHLGTDIVATRGESVLATLDGTVILSAYTAESGYVIAVQHSRDFVSFYKHCGTLLKHEGESVVGGEAIAIVGMTGQEVTGPHLHFELWHKGRPVNPELYVVF